MGAFLSGVGFLASLLNPHPGDRRSPVGRKAMGGKYEPETKWFWSCSGIHPSTSNANQVAGSERRFCQQGKTKFPDVKL